MAIKIEFENLRYQEEASSAVIGLFDGLSSRGGEFGIKEGLDLISIGYSNPKISLSEDKLLGNLNAIEERFALELSSLNKLQKSNMNFNIEMETGTGKTYVYINTILRLNLAYGFKKFIIVVPSIAIKEGVSKSLQMTKEHFSNIYSNLPYSHFVYDSSKDSRIRTFAMSSNIEIMIITISAFDKSKNVINKVREDGTTLMEMIQKTRPIVIIDEPQSVDTTVNAKEAIKSLNPLFTLRYSATHREKDYPLVYRLNSIDAFSQNLVKKIEVFSTTISADLNAPYIYLERVEASGTKNRDATIVINHKNKESIEQKRKKVKVGDDLEEITSLSYYAGYIVDDIYTKKGGEYISFSNGKKISLNTANIDDTRLNLLSNEMIKNTIETHLDKELRLEKLGIKVLSLFFIDEVSKYRLYDSEGRPSLGEYAKTFEKIYTDLISKDKYKALKSRSIPVNLVHNGYFAMDKKGHFLDIQEGKEAKDKESAKESAYHKIMIDKEGLLSFSEPLRFIFSHSALKEGWDNPNVFQICTLKKAGASEIRKRQEIGRGLRICVNQEGKRVQDSDNNINNLTIITQEDYKVFVEKLQKDYEEDGIIFGAIVASMFANLELKDEISGTTRVLNTEEKQDLIKILKDSGYLNKDNKPTRKFIEDRDSGQFLVPQYEILSEQIGQVITENTKELPVKNARDKIIAPINKEILEGEGFKILWNKIKDKSRYEIKINDEILQECKIALSTLASEKTSLRVENKKANIGINKEGIQSKETAHNFEDREIKSSIAKDFIKDLEESTRLTRATILELLKAANTKEAIDKNPNQFFLQAAKILANKLSTSREITYYKTGLHYDLEEVFKDSIECYKGEELSTTKAPYKIIKFDSNVEKELAKKFEESALIKVYAKLPKDFTIDTPIGKYNPDWAIVVGDAKELYFIIESKGTNDISALRPSEEYKIYCGKKHFKALDLDLGVCKDFKDIENLIASKQRR